MATRSPSPRYSIAEWFGEDIITMSPDKRKKLGELSIFQADNSDLSQAPICPFLSELIPGSRCNKPSGVCSIRRYQLGDEGSGSPVPGEKVVTVCPSRFLQPLTNGETLFSWISKVMLDISNPTIVKETPFLRTVSDSDSRESDDVVEGKKAGRIDWIIVDPASMESLELKWCAVETQALYFSGSKMRLEFEDYLTAPQSVRYPVGQRRPDYRSSGPKRLSPQLDVKVPVLRNWGKKVVVVIDQFFYANMNALVDAYPRAKDDQERRDNSDVVWFVVDYDENFNMIASKVIFTTLDSSRLALSATEPLSKADFTQGLLDVIDDPGRTNKVFKPV
tara:strand:+ start:3694 stop:4695 length:1002 start_codon:yes stop_codon:yes gene_type:complete